MRRIKLSGRERAVMKAIGFADAMPGAQIREHTQIPPDDLTDVLNGLIGAGYVESRPYLEQITSTELATTEFEVNPSYAHELKDALLRVW
jgi:DNA-binding MarR family transcriptional regulator